MLSSSYFIFSPFKHHGFLFASGVTWIPLSHEEDNIEQPKEIRSHSTMEVIQSSLKTTLVNLRETYSSRASMHSKCTQ